MKIALCNESMMPRLGGCETYLADLVRYLVQDQHEVHLFTSRLDTTAFPQSVKVHAISRPTGLRFLRPWSFARSCYVALQQHTFDVSVGFCKTWGQDVLIPQAGFHAASADHNLGKYPSALLRRVLRGMQSLDPKQWLFRAMERKQLFGFQSLIVAPSRMVQDHAREYYHLGTDRVRVVHNAIAAERFPTHDRLRIRSQLRDQQKLLPEDNVGLFVGHNYQLKGLIPLLESLTLLDASMNFKLLVCGGSRYSRFQRLAHQLGVADRVHFLGYHPEVREAFFAADFLVHPTFYDPCALVTMEALACGLPVITTRLNGGVELLPGEMLQLTIETPHDQATMAKHIARLCDPRLRAPLVRAAREAARQWTFTDHYHALLDIFQEVVASKPLRQCG